MASKGSPEYRARRRERERRRREQQESPPAARTRSSAAVPADGVGHGEARRAAAGTCGWCGGPITPRSRGPIPKWCSASCRHRAWEQARAAASGLSAVRVVERLVQVPAATLPTRRDWPELLHELGRQLDDGRVYDRDLSDLGSALTAVLEAYNRRPYVRAQSAVRHPWRHPG